MHYVYVYPNQQHGWPLRPHHTLSPTEQRGICQKIPEIYGEFLSTNDYYLKVASYIQLQGIKSATLIKLGKICQTCFFPASLGNQKNFSPSCFWLHLR